jgi:hypothetical protein
MNNMECFLSHLSSLKHVQLDLIGNNDLADGYRWQMLTTNWTTFIFKFHLELISDYETLISFQTLFWLEEKHWFVTYTDSCLHSIRHSDINEKHLNIYSYQELIQYIPLENTFPYIRELNVMHVPTSMLKKIEGYQFNQIDKLDIHMESDDKNLEYMIKTLIILWAPIN